jgi:hypothetical protein
VAIDDLVAEGSPTHRGGDLLPAGTGRYWAVEAQDDLDLDFWGHEAGDVEFIEALAEAIVIYRGPHGVVNTDTVPAGPVGKSYLLADDVSPARLGPSGGDCRANRVAVGKGESIDPFGRWVDGRPQVTRPDQVLRQRFNVG